MEKLRSLDIDAFSKSFSVKRMHIEDASMIYEMTRQNLQYYEFCGRENVVEDIENDLRICPPGKSLEEKYYVGFFDGETLVAVMDFIDGYPDETTAYIGFFMMNQAYQGKGIGTKVVLDLFSYLKEIGFKTVSLGYEKSNPQSSHFWKKNQFHAVREVMQEDAIIVVAERVL